MVHDLGGLQKECTVLFKEMAFAKSEELQNQLRKKIDKIRDLVFETFHYNERLVWKNAFLMAPPCKAYGIYSENKSIIIIKDGGGVEKFYFSNTLRSHNLRIFENVSKEREFLEMRLNDNEMDKISFFMPEETKWNIFLQEYGRSIPRDYIE
jgi:hypothetical protein